MHRRLHYNIFMYQHNIFRPYSPPCSTVSSLQPSESILPYEPNFHFRVFFSVMFLLAYNSLIFQHQPLFCNFTKFCPNTKKSISGPAVTNVSILFRLTQYRVFELVSRSVFFSEQSLQRWKHQTSIPLSQITMLWEMSKYFVFSNPWTEIFLSPYYL